MENSRIPSDNNSSLLNVTNDLRIQTINWTAINEEGWFEGYLTVPVDHYNDDVAPNTTFQIYCFRHTPTTTNSAGLIYYNFGGPGVQADAIMALFPNIPQEIQNNYDLIACDPRGTGDRNKPNLADCADAVTLNPVVDYRNIETYHKAVQEKTITGLETCANTNAILMQHIGTRQVVADIDLLRATMGFSNISFVGYSYGTRMGGIYATQYPNRINKLVLDSNMPPADNVLKLAEEFALEANASFTALLNVCKNAKATCAFNQNVGDKESDVFDSVFEKFQSAILTQKTFEVNFNSDKVLVYPLLAMLAFVEAIESKSKDLALNLLQTMSEYNLNQNSNTSTTAINLDLFNQFNFTEADIFSVSNPDAMVHYIVLAMDTSQRYSESQIWARAEMIEKTQGLIGRKSFIDQATAFLIESVFGQNRFLPDPVPEILNNNIPMLVLGNLGDSATPYPWSQRMSLRFSEGKMISTPLAQHGVYLMKGIGGNDKNGDIFDCVDKLVNTYLIS
eukprot:Awhi_evm1s12131